MCWDVRHRGTRHDVTSWRLRSTHVHDGDAVLVELVNGPLGGNTDGAHKELGALLDDDVDELGKLALGVVVVGLASATTDLGDKEVDTEGCWVMSAQKTRSQTPGPGFKPRCHTCDRRALFSPHGPTIALTELGVTEVLLEVLDHTAEVLGAA